MSRPTLCSSTGSRALAIDTQDRATLGVGLGLVKSSSVVAAAFGHRDQLRKVAAFSVRDLRDSVLAEALDQADAGGLSQLHSAFLAASVLGRPLHQLAQYLPLRVRQEQLEDESQMRSFPRG
ncbi:MAG TPA: hypothetical protein VKI99_09100 [Candidatus Dormibacteraeota bacterium]|nr:hypothetical protein [Candidatus Dormibacteraeota bacterium]